MGGWSKEDGNPLPWSGWRDVCVPIVLSAWITFHFNLWLGVACGLTLNIIRMGYGNYDPITDSKPSLLGALTHDRNGWHIRGICGALYVLIGLLPLAIYTHHWISYVLAALISGGVNWVLCRIKAPDWVIEPIVGATLAVIVIFF